MYDIYFDLNNMHQTVNEADEENQIDFDFELDLPEGDSGSVDDYPVIVRRSRNGCTCKTCGEIYPYAEGPNQPDGSFKCWSCRNF